MRSSVRDAFGGPPDHPATATGPARTSLVVVTFPHLELAADPHDRVGERRADEAWLDAAWAAPETRVLVVAGTRVRPVDDAVHVGVPAEAPGAGTRVLLGRARRPGVVRPRRSTRGGAPRGRAGSGIRDLLPHLAGAGVEQAPLVFHAIGLAEWLFATRYCPRCGGRLEPRLAGHELECVECHRRQFPRTDPAVIMAITDGEPGVDGRGAACSAARTSGRRVATRRWRASCEPGETLEDAVRREVAEETGVVVGEVTYFGNQPWPLPASLMLGFLRPGGLDATSRRRRARSQDARWFTRAADARRGRGGHAGAARWGLDQPVAGRALVRRSAARLLVSRLGRLRTPARPASP